MNLLIVPVVVGQGTRLFPDTGADMALDMVDSRAFSKGITMQVYQPVGRLVRHLCHVLQAVAVSYCGRPVGR